MDQMSVVIRHVSVEDTIKISESFLGFITLTHQNAAKISEEVCTFLNRHNLDIKKCRGQGYDGAAVMSGKYGGVQAIIKDLSPNAEYVHCASHNLNLVLNDAVNDVLEITVFFSVINHIYVFFSESLPRWQSLRSTENESCIIQKTLKRLCPTRWSSRHDCLLAVRCNYTSVLCCLTNIALTSKNKAEVTEATGIRKQMASFDFVLMLVFQSKVLESVNLTSKTLQKEDISLDEASFLLKKSTEMLQNLRDNFEKIVEESKKLSETWGIDPELSTRRPKKVKSFFDELSSDVTINDPMFNFKVKVFNKSLDVLIGQLKNRFEGMNAINENFSFLTPNTMIDKSDNQLKNEVQMFCKKYAADVSEALVSQVISMKNIFSNEIKRRSMTKISELAHFLMIENRTLSSSLPDICTALTMFLTLPVTSATSER